MKYSRVLEEISLPLAQVSGVLENLASRVVELRSEGRFDSGSIVEMVEALEPYCAQVLANERRSVVGVGIVWEAGQGADEESGMLWWRADGGVVARKEHVFNPDSDSFYDYRSSEWYEAARDTEGLAIVGPFIDAWGTDDHTITPSLGILDGGVLIGVAAADLNVPAFTGELASILRRHGDFVLVGSEDRVVASNHPLLSPGLRLDPCLSRSGARVVERMPVGVAGWYLLELAQAE